MAKVIAEFILEYKQKILENCTACGICIKKCPVYKSTSLSSAQPVKLQKDILTFLQGGEPNENIFKRTFYCMFCYKCVNNTCPKNLNPVIIIYLLRNEYRERKIYSLSLKSAKNFQMVLSSIQTTPQEYQKIFTQSNHQSAEYVFFPGCAVYIQPDKLLSAMDIMDITGVDYAFVPGVKNCCGINYFTEGNFTKIDNQAQLLIKTMLELNPQTVIFWCSTCMSIFKMIYTKLFDLSFEMITLTQFITRYISKFEFNYPIREKATLHESCKAAYMDLDIVSAREILCSIPGIELVEMDHIGHNTECCGGLTLDAYPHEMRSHLDQRMNEAKETGAELLVDVCQSCHDRLINEEEKCGFEVANYITIIARALGIEREDKLKKYRKLGNINKVLDEVSVYLNDSIYSKEQIVFAAKKIITKEI